MTSIISKQMINPIQKAAEHTPSFLELAAAIVYANVVSPLLIACPNHEPNVI